MIESTSLRSSAPSSPIGRYLNLAPVSAATFCHGTRLLWCSISVTTISSPGPTLPRGHEWATRLMASVALRVQMISSGDSALMKRATLARASSNRSVASMLRACTPLCTFEL